MLTPVQVADLEAAVAAALVHWGYDEALGITADGAAKAIVGSNAVVSAVEGIAAAAWDKGAGEGLRTVPKLAYTLTNPHRADG